MIDKSYPHSEFTGQIISLAMAVHKELGQGFLEIIYKDALEYEFQLANLQYNEKRNTK